MFEVKAKLSSEFATEIESIGIKSHKNFEERNNNMNNLTLAQLNVETGDVFELFIKDSPEKEEEPLIDE